MKSIVRRFAAAIAAWLSLSAPGGALALETIEMPHGEGTIVYGPVANATTPAAAMGKVLRTVHQSCQDRPQVGKVFRVRNSDSFAVFFTVVNHPQGDKHVAGLLIASAAGPGGVEAALVSDEASRFGNSVNPMLTRLFGVWHPGGATAAAPAKNAPAPPRHSGRAAKLHTVTTSDNSASIGLPEGWSLDPGSGRGAVMVKGPHGEHIAAGLFKSGVDPTHPWQRNFTRMGGRPLPGQMVCPYHGGLARAFPDMLQAWRRSNGLGSAKLQVDKIQPISAPPDSPQGEECVSVQGHLDPNGEGMLMLNELMCATLPVDWGGYVVSRNQILVPDSLAKQDEATVGAILASWKVNQAVVNQQNAQMLRQKQANDRALQAQTQQAIANIHAIGAAATARYNATQAANDAQHAGYWAQQDANARHGQDFSNYLLDQTVIQSNDVYGNGSGVVGHGTVWNSTADALVKSNPNRYEYVSTPGFWRGIDY